MKKKLHELQELEYDDDKECFDLCQVYINMIENIKEIFE